VDVRTPRAGLIKEVSGAEGDTVAVGAGLAVIDTSAAKPAGGAAPAPAPAKAEGTHAMCMSCSAHPHGRRHNPPASPEAAHPQGPI
jgi:2-oxoglutarate dehydrogenase E2 component (dihydrolipoamide succinyltransferase)